MNKLEKKKMHRALYENKKILESIKEFNKRYRVSVRKMILNHISQSDGFDENDLGTQYLASLMAVLFHERRMYYLDYKDRGTEYYDLSNEDNEHFGMFGVSKDKFLSEINKSIEKNDFEEGPLDELVYDVVDYFIFRYGQDRDSVIKRKYGLIKK